MNPFQVVMLSLGHLVTDLAQGAFPASLPFFISEYGFTYKAAGTLVFGATMASSIAQPIFGYSADRFSKPWILCMGMMLAGWGIALTGVLGSYIWILAVVMLSGVGVAAYHPVAARLVNLASGDKKGLGMSLFGVGGTLGFATGPAIAAMALLHWGLKGILVVAVPVTVISLALIPLFSGLRGLEKGGHNEARHDGSQAMEDQWWPFARLTLAVIGRSIVFYGLNTFIPIYWIHRLHQSKAAGAMALTIFAATGVVGNLLGGSLADRIGQKRVMVLGFMGMSVFLPSLLIAAEARLAIALLIPVALSMYFTYSPSIVLGQSYLPRRIGFSSGVTLGLAFAIGGACVPVIGAIADAHGVWHAVATIAGLPVFLLVLALTLPRPKAVAWGG